MIDLRPVRGMKDYTPEEYYPLLEVMSTLSRVAESFGYSRIETPALESLEVLRAKAGDEVLNEIYYLRDKANRELGLRFDLTVPIARVISYRADLPKPVRWYYVSKVWRYDEPQHGRYREFHQFGIELVGSSTLRADAEVITIAAESIARSGLSDAQVHINDRRIMDQILGKIGVREALRQDVLRIMDKRGKVDVDEMRRMLRSLDLGDSSIEELIHISSTIEPLNKGVEILREYVANPGFVESYNKLMELLRIMGTLDRVWLDMGIVRGLDYYTGLIFEVYTPGYKLSLGGGGRYDDLIGIYSGRSIPALGFAVGVERLVEVLLSRGIIKHGSPPVDYYIYPLNDETNILGLAYSISNTLRSRGNRVIVDTGERSLRSALEYASKIGTRYFVMIGPRELAKGVVKVRDMASWSEGDVPVDEFLKSQ